MKFLIVMLLFPLTSQAGSLSCRSVESLNDTVNDCADNTRYVEAGRDCVLQFQIVALAAKERALKEVASAGGKALAVQSLSSVMELGVEAENRVSQYLGNIVFPEDWDAPSAVIGNANQFFDRHACYAKSRDGLEKLVEKVRAEMKLLVNALDSTAIAVKVKR